MKSKVLPFLLISAVVLIAALQSCSKSNSERATIYNTWTFTHGHGTVAINGNIEAVSENSNTNNSVTVQFQNSGTYHYQVKSLLDETGAFTYSDSTILLASESSFFANVCAYPMAYFTTTPGQDLPIQQHVSPILRIVFLSSDSLLLKSTRIKPAANGRDTVYDEYSGFRKQQ